MTRIVFNPLLEQLHGQFGEMVFRRSHAGSIYLSRKPDMSRVAWSKAQTAHRTRFRQAIAYARAAMADPQARATYEKEAAARGRRPFHLAVSDYFKGRDLLAGGKKP